MFGRMAVRPVDDFIILGVISPEAARKLALELNKAADVAEGVYQRVEPCLQSTGAGTL